MASSIRFWLCFILILLSCPRFESCPLEPFTSKRKETTMMETAREIIRERMSHAIKYEVKRLSPRGPNPKHH
ncbi:hypothetical protein KY290_004691 [Solanum tuberosum]|uniref:CLAVATA3/ESR (CLE)-related protein n=1 Tax=Solanum tuberosum TaxID=4113 RepID=A0ABQ7WBY9_SOLTU|nr:hypothetical protein KY285_004618 [Solanum tuberosum]KAH0778264.1 hypothetical protein KY290_004691 [Solanum tuberosum]